jgi:phytoene dehydrogenase-like protein
MIDAIVIGSGPNGLSAAIMLAQAGLKVQVLEANASAGGGVRSAELTLPGFTHDLCSAVHPFAVASPFFRDLPLSGHGLEWVYPSANIGHPLDDGTAVIAERSLEATAEHLGRDAEAYRRLLRPIVVNWPLLERGILGPLTVPRHPIALARFGLRALRSIDSVARSAFATERARALLAGVAGHGMMPLDFALTAGVGLTLTALSHVAGWPFPRGGAQELTDALAAHLRSLGGEITLDERVTNIDKLPPARAVLCDLSPRPLLGIAGHKFPGWFRRKLERYRYGMGAFKMDWALSEAIPWAAQECRRAGTVHLGGTLDEIAAAERETWNGRIVDRPFVLLSQPTLFDPSRAPAGRHVAWGYCHVPHGSTVDMVERIENQIERYAPGFRDCVMGRSVMTPADLEARNANLVGGDIAGGVCDVRQFFTRPTWRNYGTPVKGLYLCSSSTPPGVGVHGMCGYFAAKLALKELRY